MSATIIELPFQAALRTPIGHVIRTGETSFRQLEHLHAQGRLPASSIIVDASKARFQREFIRSLRESVCDVILDTKAAELSEVGKFRGAAKSAPWSITDSDRPLNLSDFEIGSNSDLYGKIARHAVELGVTAVMAPTHFLRDGANDPWSRVDRIAAPMLRAALDREGGSAIAIDYPLITPHTLLLDADQRRLLNDVLRDQPIDNLIVRLSGFGADAGPLAVKRTLIALEELRRFDFPVILDHVGGLVGLSALAFGAVSAVAYGIGEHDRFDAREWHKPPKDRDPDAPFGRSAYIPVPGFDKSFRKADFKAIVDSPGGRRLLACNDPNCCPRGFDFVDNPRAHIARQKHQDVDDLSKVPDARRAQHFLERQMRTAERKAGDLARVNTGREELNKSLAAGRKRIDSMARMYETLADRERASIRPIQRRGRSFGAAGQARI